MSDLRIVVAPNVIENIGRTLVDADVEDGGKLIGYFNRSSARPRIEVVSFLPSGIRVSHSQNHLMPDGVYQDTLFQHLAHFDDDLEHIGSWHSHHCNGLRTLSDGDVHGYVATLSNPNYRLPIFLAMLVTSLRSRRPELKYFLFERGARKFIEFSDREVEIDEQLNYRYEEIIAVSNKLALARRAQLAPNATGAESDAEKAQELDRLSARQLADHKWISSHFPTREVLRDRRSGGIRWYWPIMDHGRPALLFEYADVVDGTADPAKIAIAIKDAHGRELDRRSVAAHSGIKELTKMLRKHAGIVFDQRV